MSSRGWTALLALVGTGTTPAAFPIPIPSPCILSQTGIVFANKAVFQTYGFHFTYALTWIHTVFTLVGMRIFAAAGMFPVKAISQRRLVPLAAAYVAYIVLCNLSLKVNTVGFYQVRTRRRAALPSRLPPRPLTAVR